MFYSELRSRVNCSANIDDMSINYAQNRYWSEKSGDLNQKVNTVNIPFQVCKKKMFLAFRIWTTCLPAPQCLHFVLKKIIYLLTAYWTGSMW